MARKVLHPAINDIDLPTVLNALGDPIRLEIIFNLHKKGGTSCMGCCPENLSKSTLSHHFRILREAGIIRSEKEGVTLLNTLRKDELNKKFPGLLESVLKYYLKNK